MRASMQVCKQKGSTQKEDENRGFLPSVFGISWSWVLDSWFRQFHTSEGSLLLVTTLNNFLTNVGAPGA